MATNTADSSNQERTERVEGSKKYYGLDKEALEKAFNAHSAQFVLQQMPPVVAAIKAYLEAVQTK